MQPFSWSEAELRVSKPSDLARTEKRYSLDNENFDFNLPLEIFWALDEYGLFRAGATYYAADFALVEPDCFDTDEFLGTLTDRYLEKFEPTGPVCFNDVDATARTALRRAIDVWVGEYAFVGQQWCIVGESYQLTVSQAEIPDRISKMTNPSQATL